MPMFASFSSAKFTIGEELPGFLQHIVFSRIKYRPIMTSVDHYRDSTSWAIYNNAYLISVIEPYPGILSGKLAEWTIQMHSYFLDLIALATDLL
jgi:hypothetical protein